MIKNILKKLFLGITLAGVTTFTALASACSVETDHPTAKITIEFNSETYELEYTLYRNMYPNTVRHFIELADNGFYEDMLVHNYGTQDWYTGGYTYNPQLFSSASTTEAFAQYIEDTSKESQYMSLFNAKKLTPTVYSRLGYNASTDTEVIDAQYALPTLIGEFYNNISQEIENGALKADYGSIKMYYYQKSSKQKVYVTPTTDQIIWGDYENNCATSIFSLQTTSGTSLSADQYCVFGKITNVTVLDQLLDDVSNYLSGTYGSSLTSDQTYSVSAVVDTDVEVFSNENSDKGIQTTFRLTKKPIIVRSVKITAY